jgi:hypothetical protein
MNRKNKRIALGIGAVALLAGAVGPWASVLGAISVGPTANTEITIVVFGGIALVALAAATNRALRVASMLTGGLAIAEAVYALVRIEQVKSDAGEFGGLISPGWGLYLTILAGLYLLASTWIVGRRKEEVQPA